MSLGRLLAAGKSLVGLSGGAGRYRVSKQARLPKFISPKNPFASREAPTKPPVTEPLPAPTPTPTAAPKPVVAVARAETIKAGKEFSRAPRSARVVIWFAALGQKLKPRSRWSQTPGPVKSVAQQGELSLDAVQVVRNDLSDTDFAAVRSAASKPVSPVRALTAEKLEPVSAAWHRLTTKFLGVDQP